METLEMQVAPGAPLTPLPRVVEVDERDARRSLREQIARLERELAQAFVAAAPQLLDVEWRVGAAGGPRVLDLGELETVRDDLAARLKVARDAISARADVEERNRILVEEMLLDPAAHKFRLVSNEDLGEPGCRHVHVRPRFGVVGMFLNWWRVKISSGCPLAAAPRDVRGAGAEVGKRSRKRGDRPVASRADAPVTAGARATGEDADAALRRLAETTAPDPRRRRAPRERPPAPWGRFPLVELCVLLAIVIGIAGFATGGDRGNLMIATAAALGSLAGLELSLREHLTGYRSHTALLSLAAALAGTMAVAALLVAVFGEVLGYVLPVVAVVLFALSFRWLRGLFRRRSGGASFR